MNNIQNELVVVRQHHVQDKLRRKLWRWIKIAFVNRYKPCGACALFDLTKCTCVAKQGSDLKTRVWFRICLQHRVHFKL